MKRTVRWRIVVLYDHERSRATLRAAILAAGGEVVGEATRCADALESVRDSRADVGIFAVGLGDGDGVDVAAEVIAGGCPVVLFTSHTGDELVERARAAGVMAFLVKPLRPAELLPAVDLAIARFRETQTLRQRLDERKLVERAKGILMARSGLSEDQTYRHLRRTAMDRRIPMAEVAREVLASESLLINLPTP
ncbi:MAG TPA: ANTAR domain-containing protein [Methylomirabilota bacterium]|nr:ANTAR domain-containing protein [Methylomirabilota bacterium]